MLPDTLYASLSYIFSTVAWFACKMLYKQGYIEGQIQVTTKIRKNKKHEPALGNEGVK